MDTIIHLILGIIFGFGFRRKIEAVIANFTKDLEAVDNKFDRLNNTVEDILTESLYQFEDNDWDINDNGVKTAKLETIANLMEGFKPEIIVEEALDAGFGITIAIYDKFNDNLLTKMPIFIPYTTFTKQDKRDKYFQAFKLYIIYAKIWNELYKQYPTQLPYAANDKDSTVTFNIIHERICRNPS